MPICPECGSLAPDSFAECPTCGTPLNGQLEAVSTEACPHCGEQIASEAEACPACGEIRTPHQCSRHADRSARGVCVVCGAALCDACNAGGDAHYLCEPHRQVPVVGGWAQVYTTDDDLEAGLIRDHLEAAGVDARVISQKDHFSLPVDLGELSRVRVLVPAYDFLDATTLIEEHMDESGEVRFGDEEAAADA